MSYSIINKKKYLTIFSYLWYDVTIVKYSKAKQRLIILGEGGY